MNKLFNLVYYSCICIMLLLTGCSSQETSNSSHEDNEPDTTRHLKIKVNYFGTGIVDSNHQLWVCLFDIEKPLADSNAVSYIALHSNSDTATFILYSSVNFYLRVGYDFNASGSYHLKTGDRFQFYENKATTPVDPIKVESGQTVEITVNLSDTNIH